MTDSRAKAGYLFHATRAVSLADIQSHGLKPNTEREPTFNGYPVNGRLFVTTSEREAEFYARTISCEFDYEAAVLRFPASTISRINPDPFGNPGDFWTDETIPSEVIDIRLREGVWQPLKQAGVTPPSLMIDEEVAPRAIGTLAVFSYSDRIDLTNDGQPVKPDDFGNMIARFIVRDRVIFDAATPRVAEYENEVRMVLEQLGLEVVGTAKKRLGMHGIAFEDGSWDNSDNQPASPPFK